ncbi:PEP-CTERM sorting domain-containing protein [Methyloversatilis thermotolerans]|uniref:PEP-CTERM sorting domain-containing protein n=1 Tax=Methyloversatilis thermotolerans TaxID=1346290 RepID=UPI0012FC11DA|nr:PEP-CTERM sorting domain-containing protein [Methyloversatilis thermotolerans]
MNIRNLVFGASIALSSVAHAVAGEFASLPTSGNLRIEDFESFQIDSGPSNGANSYALPGFLTVLDQRVTEFEHEGETVGNFFDYVFSDSTGSLYFGSRLVLSTPEDEDDYFEINDLFRTGYAGVTDVSVAWAFVTDYDLWIYAAARTSAGFGEEDTLDLDSVGFRSDINWAEGNPQTALYLIKTDATSYKLLDGAVRLRQGGEEDEGDIVNISFAGFAPVTAPVPEPSAYALLLSGLALTGFMAKRRRS